MNWAELVDEEPENGVFVGVQKPRAKSNAKKDRADFTAIKDALDNDPRQFETRLREILKKARDATVQWAEDRIKNLEPEQIINLTVDTGAPMVKALNDLLTHFWQRGRDIGLGELPEKVQQEPAVQAAKTFEWDESKHPRGETTDASTPGSFAPGSDGGKTVSISELRKNGIPAGHAVRGVRQPGLVLGQGESGVWATDSIDNALSYGENLELVKLPDKMWEGDLLGLMNHFRKPKDALLGVDELTKKDWDRAEKYLKSKGYGGANFGHQASDKSNDFWIFAQTKRSPVKMALVRAIEFQFGPGMEPLDAMRAMTARSWLIRGIIEDALRNAARRELMKHLEGGRTNNETIGALREVFEPYIGDPTAITPTGMRGPEWPAGMSPENILAAFRLENIVRTESAWALNQGRVSMGDAAGDYVVGYEYSAILDQRTTDICRTADGLLLKKEDPRTAALLPPNHFQCRSTVIYLTTDDAPIEFSSDAKIDRAVSLIQDGFA